MALTLFDVFWWLAMKQVFGSMRNYQRWQAAHAQVEIENLWSPFTLGQRL